MLCLLISHIESRIRIGPSSPEWLSSNKSLYVVVFTPFPFNCAVSTNKNLPLNVPPIRNGCVVLLCLSPLSLHSSAAAARRLSPLPSSCVPLSKAVYGDLASKLKAFTSTEATTCINKDVGWIRRSSSGDLGDIRHGFNGLFDACSTQSMCKVCRYIC